jgi:hypothetical protein
MNSKEIYKPKTYREASEEICKIIIPEFIDRVRTSDISIGLRKRR